MAHTTSTEVVLAVARAADVDPTELPPLSDVLDTDALDALFDDGRTGAVRAPEVRFTYAGREVRIGADREVTVDGRPQRA